MKTVKYEVTFKVNGLPRKVVQEVPVSAEESRNMSAAVVGASLKLDDEGVKHWALVTVAKVTS